MRTKRIKRLWLILYYRNLWVRVTLVLFTAFCIPALILTTFVVTASRKITGNLVSNNHQLIATRVAKEATCFIEEPESSLTSVAAVLGAVYPAPLKQEKILKELVRNQPVFMRISSVDRAGQELARSELLKGSDWTYSREAFQHARKGKSYISKIKFSGKSMPFATLSAPIKMADRIMGVVIADVDLRGLRDSVENTKVGATGRAFLASSEEIQALQAKDKRGENTIWLNAYASIPALGCGVVFKQARSEAYLPFKAIEMGFWLIIAITVTGIVLSVFMAQTLVRPIKLLALSAKNIAAGNLEQEIRVKRHDEIGVLIKSFNGMAATLKKNQANERLSAMGEAAAWVFHEFKNSLLSIKSFVELIPERHTDKKFMDTFAKLIPQEVTNCQRILNQLFDFSSNYTPHMVTINATTIVTDILEIMNGEIDKKSVKLIFHTSSETMYIRADPEKLKQVFGNLIINALQSMPQGGSLLISLKQVTVASPGERQFMEVEVRDSGIGIAPQELKKIFEPFHTTRAGGMGLGLTIARKIIELHGGTVCVESELNRGTRFTVRLPIDTAAAAQTIAGANSFAISKNPLFIQ